MAHLLQTWNNLGSNFKKVYVPQHIIFILGIILGVFLGWKYELAINDFIESIKIHLNIK